MKTGETAVRSLAMMMSLEIRRYSFEKPSHADGALKSGETALRSLDMLMSLEIRRNSFEKPRHADEP